MTQDNTISSTVLDPEDEKHFETASTAELQSLVWQNCDDIKVQFNRMKSNCIACNGDNGRPMLERQAKATTAILLFLQKYVGTGKK